MALSEKEKRRYARQVILPEIGESGQKRLLSAKVLVIGAGGLGSPALLYLAAAGVGTIGVVDDDKVDLLNLNRQIIHESGDVGRAKTESAVDSIKDLNPNTKVIAHQFRIDNENAESIIKDYDVVLDGSDNFETRFLLHDLCYTLHKPYISAAVLGFEGQLSVFKGYQNNQPCYRCLYQDVPPPGTMPSCAENGIIGTVTGIMGAWQANEAIKEILNIGESLSGNLIIFNALHSHVRKVVLKKDKNCNFCHTMAKRTAKV